MHIHKLFPTPVGFFELPRELEESELSFVLGLDKTANAGNTTSANRNLLKTPELTKLREWVEDCLTQYFDGIYAPQGVSPYITQSWANYTEPGQHHHKHAHPCSFVSGVFYVDADKDVDKIFFFKEKYDMLKIPAKSWNDFNSESWWFPVKTGLLILFPSHLTHMVETKQGNNLRTSIAFNTFVKGRFGNEENLTGLYLGEA